MEQTPLQGEAGERGSRRAQFTKYALIGVVVPGLVLLSVVSFSRPPHVENPAARVLKPTREGFIDKRSHSSPPAELKPQPAPAMAGALTPRPMRLTRRVLLEKLVQRCAGRLKPFAIWVPYPSIEG